MPRITDMIESKFLKKEDVGDGVLVNIVGVEKQNVARPDEKPEMKWVLHTNGNAGTNKPLVLNSTNLKLISKIIGSDNTDDWAGQEIVLYNDPSVSFQGELKGGIRVRAKRSQVQNF